MREEYVRLDEKIEEIGRATTDREALQLAVAALDAILLDTLEEVRD